MKLDELPQLISFQIIEWCDLQTRLSFFATCKAHYQASFAPVLWRDVELLLHERNITNEHFSSMMEYVCKRGSRLEEISIHGSMHHPFAFAIPKDPWFFPQLKHLTLQNFNANFIQSLGILPHLTRLSVTDTEGYFIMNKSSINAQYSKPSHYPMSLTGIMNLFPNLQELVCDFLMAPEKVPDPPELLVFPQMRRLSLVSYLITIRPGHLGGEDWSEDRKIEKLYQYFPNLDSIEIRDPVLCCRQSTFRQSALKSWFYVDDKQIKGIMQTWKQTLAKLEVEKANISINFMQFLKATHTSVLIIVGPQSIWPVRLSAGFSSTKPIQNWRPFPQLDFEIKQYID